MVVLVVGANGQLGSEVCRRLVAGGHEVRGSVRRRERAAGLGLDGVALVEADLARSPDLDGLLADVEALVLTANTAAPRAGDDVSAFTRGASRLVTEAGRRGLRRLVLPSIAESPVEAAVPFAAERRALETQVRAEVPDSVVLRFPPFMECWLALVGSSVPLRGEPGATIGRPSPFLRRFRSVTGTSVERRGLMLVPGPTTARQAFIAVADAAAACVAAVDRPALGGSTVEVGGPQVLTWDEVASIFARHLGRPVRAVSTPAGVFAAAAAVLRPVAEVPSRTMGLNRYLGSSESAWEPGGGVLDPASMTTVDEFIAAKAVLPETLPTVV